jgi:D-alanyl-D-alanine dipeptidase
VWVFAAFGCAGPSASPSTPIADTPEHSPPPAEEVSASLLREAPDGFVDLAVSIPKVRTEIRYHSSDNFTGKPLTGYGAAGAWMRDEPAAALAKVQEELEAKGLGLLIYDAYRPVRATQAMVAWAERAGRVDVLDDGYVSRKSGHNRGNTVDLTIIALETGELLDMGTPWDTFSTDSHTANASGPSADNRKLLLDVMTAHGWENYPKEWWHFSFAMQPSPEPRDVPYGCFEPDEGTWEPPAGWNEPGYEMPDTWPAADQVECE